MEKFLLLPQKKKKRYITQRSLNVVKTYLKHSFTTFRKCCERNKQTTLFNVVLTCINNV